MTRHRRSRTSVVLGRELWRSVQWLLAAVTASVAVVSLSPTWELNGFTAFVLPSVVAVLLTVGFVLLGLRADEDVDATVPGSGGMYLSVASVLILLFAASLLPV